MKKISLFALFISVFICLGAQWSSDASQPTLVVNGLGEQVMPKIAIDAAGNCYMSYFDNSTGNYRVWLRRFNLAGYPTYNPPTGILLSDHTSETWLTDYDMTLDQGGNPIVTFQDIRTGSNNVFVYKYSAFVDENLWGNNGIQLSNDTSTEIANYTPIVINTADDNTYVAWMRMGGDVGEIRLQRIGTGGTVLWGEGGQPFNSTAGDCTWPQFVLSDNNTLLMKYYVDSGPYWAPTRHMYVTKLTPDGVSSWTTPITTAGGISAWNQIIGFESDGSGGAVLAWYDDRNSDMVNEAYVARITSSGALTTAENGSLVTGNTGNQQYYPKLAVDTAQQRIYVFYRITDADQISTGLGCQKLDYSGNQGWGAGGMSPETLSSYSVSPLYAYMTNSGAVCVYERGTVPSSDVNMQLRARCFTQDGSSGWTNEYVDIASNSTPKLHFNFDRHPGGWIAGIWEEGTSGYDIYAQKFNDDGTLGIVFYPPQNLQVEMYGSYGIHLTWDSPQGDMEPVSYEIFCNGTEVTTVDGETTQHYFEDLTPDTYSFYIRAIYSGGHTSANSNTVTITIVDNDDPVSPVIPLSLRLSPNPCRSVCTLNWEAAKTGLASIRVYNLKGQLVKEIQADTHNGVNEKQLPLNDLANGIYLIRIRLEGQSQTAKLLIQN
ncbi:MAG TPA: T9SS type A sorting domain-containing protein [Candidatus Cloacimonadota bacterium]|nr:T9SS type A sorting domain-containing protein [Candidatus Cloacimonadota bacterium]